MSDQEIAVREEFALPAQARADAQLAEIEVFQKLVHDRLKVGHDYGVIPGTGTKATLLKPGAEKIVKLARCYPDYIILKEIEDWDREPQPLFAYTVQCKIIYIPTGEVVDNGLGECNSMESKYRWRQGERLCPKCDEPAIIKGKAQYGGGWLCFRKKNGCGAKFNDNDAAITSQSTDRVLNPDIADQNNTILKMAKKRALVDAALSLGSLSDLFTQDMEDLGGRDPQSEPPPDAPSSPAEPTSEPEGTEQPGVFVNKSSIHIDDAPNNPAPTESDGGPPLFPPAIINSMGDLKVALKKLPGVQRAGWTDKTWKAEASTIIAEPLDQGRNLQGVYDSIAHHFAEQGT